MKEQKSFSLSYYFEEMKRREPAVTRQTKAASEEGFSTAAMLNVFKALKTADDHKLTLMGLAKASGLKIGACQEIAEHLEEEGLIEIEADHDTGNDHISLSSKGKEML